LAGIVFGHPVTLVIDPGVEESLVRLLAAHGAQVETVSCPHPTGGWQEARRLRVRELLREMPGAWSPDQADNPDNRSAYQSLAAELANQLGTIDVLVCSVGTGGHSAGVAKALRAFSPGLQLIGVDAVGSCLFGQPARERLMRGMGNSIHPGNVDYDAFDEVHWVAPHEAVWMCRALARHCFVSGGWSTGAAALVARWAVTRADPTQRVVAVFPDRLWRYGETIYDDDFCRRHGLLGGPPPGEPEELERPSDMEVRRWSRCTVVLDPRAAGHDRCEAAASAPRAKR
jgi:cysteine synthase A